MPSSKNRPAAEKFIAKPLVASRWRHFEALFGPRWACGGCWCMWWRETHAEFENRKGDGNKRAMRRIVSSGEVPGLIGYLDGEPVAWCSVAPRERFPRLERSRILKRIDEEPVWSVVCFFIAKSRRKLGLSKRMLDAAVRYAAGMGARIVEGYPVEPKRGVTADVFAYTGVAEIFRAAGFTEVARRSETRPIMRIKTGGPTGQERRARRSTKRSPKQKGGADPTRRGSSPKRGGKR
jgi:GNAT superfamily N-acetyltransferase